GFPLHIFPGGIYRPDCALGILRTPRMDLASLYWGYIDLAASGSCTRPLFELGIQWGGAHLRVCMRNIHSQAKRRPWETHFLFPALPVHSRHLFYSDSLSLSRLLPGPSGNAVFLSSFFSEVEGTCSSRKHSRPFSFSPASQLTFGGKKNWRRFSNFGSCRTVVSPDSLAAHLHGPSSPGRGTRTVWYNCEKLPGRPARSL